MRGTNGRLPALSAVQMSSASLPSPASCLAAAPRRLHPAAACRTPLAQTPLPAVPVIPFCRKYTSAQAASWANTLQQQCAPRGAGWGVLRGQETDNAVVLIRVRTRGRVGRG
jgi:hypothetical protein